MHLLPPMPVCLHCGSMAPALPVLAFVAWNHRVEGKELERQPDMQRDK